MTEEQVRNLILRPLREVMPADGGTPLSVDYGSLEDYLGEAARRYDAAREDYLNTDLEDEALLTKTRKFARAARQFNSWAETWYCVHPQDRDKQQNALDLIDRIAKEGGMRLNNILRQERLVKATHPEDTGRLAQIEAAYCEADIFLRRALKTHQHFIDLFTRGMNFNPTEEKAEREAGAYLASIVPLLPPDRIFTRASIFPPAPVPVGLPVPECPEVFDRVRSLPAKDLVYDPVTDELLPRPGYVSEDGKIDDSSVVFHPDTMTVDMGYVGEEKVTWNYWKPKDSSDLFDPDSWTAQYLAREYDQWLAASDPSVFRRRAWDGT